MNVNFSVMPPEGTPFAELERIRAKGPIFWSDSIYGWVASSYDDVKKVISDSAKFANEGTPMAQAFGAEAMLVIDTPLHHKIRAVWAKPASMSGVAAMAGDIEQVADNLVQPLAARLKAGEEVELVGLFEALVSEMITHLMDIPSRYKADLLDWNRVISDLAVVKLDESDPRFKQRLDAKTGVFALLRETVQDRRERLARGEEPRDLVSLMVGAEGNDGISQSIVLDNLLNLVLGALDTTVRWMGNVVVVLHRHPDVLAAIRADRSQLAQAVEEVLRLESPVQATMRIVKHDGIELAGQTLKAGEFVYAINAAANRDPNAFERPCEFDIYRKPKLNLSFGFGMHQCLGMNIARKEVQTIIGKLIDLLPPLDISEIDYGSSWSLWGPHKLVVRAA